MDLGKMVKFECRACGSHELGYQKYVKCVMPVTINDDGQLEYSLSEIDEDDYLCTENCFICMNCKAAVEHCECKFMTEADLLDYLSMGPAVRDKEHQAYLENLNAMLNESPEDVDDFGLLL